MFPAWHDKTVLAVTNNIGRPFSVENVRLAERRDVHLKILTVWIKVLLSPSEASQSAHKEKEGTTINNFTY